MITPIDIDYMINYLMTGLCNINVFIKRHLYIFIGLLFFLPSVSYAEGNVLRDAETEHFLRQIATPIWQTANLNPDDVTLVLINDPAINAFVAGGQNIFIYSGLLLDVQNVDELLGVIAHETGHIVGGHGFRIKNQANAMARESLLTTILAGAAAALTGQGDAVVGATMGIQETNQRLMMRFSRAYESSADQAGIRFLQAVNLPTTGMASFLERLSGQELLPEIRQNAYALTHPLSRDRMQAVLAQVKPGGKTPAAWQPELARVQNKLRGYLQPLTTLSNNNTDFATRYGQIQANLVEGDAKHALDLITPLLQDHSQDPYLYELQGQALLQSGDAQRAATGFAKANQLAPHEPLLLQQWGEALLQAGQPQPALKPLLEARDLDMRDANTYRILARTYGATNNIPLANVATAEAATLTGDTKLAKQKIRQALKTLPAGDPARRRMEDLQASLANQHDSDEDKKDRH